MSLTFEFEDGDVDEKLGTVCSMVSTVELTVPVVLFPALSVITAVMVSAAASAKIWYRNVIAYMNIFQAWISLQKNPYRLQKR